MPRIILISFLLAIAIPGLASAKTKTFIKDYTYQASDFDSIVYANTMFPVGTCTASSGTVLFDQLPASPGTGDLAGCMSLVTDCGPYLDILFNVTAGPP